MRRTTRKLRAIGGFCGCVTLMALMALLTLAALPASAQNSGVFTISGPIEVAATTLPTPTGVSAARCGPSVVVGFADSEPGPMRSTAGVAISKNASAFSDQATLADPLLSFGGGSSPVIGCSDPKTFHYATLGFSEDFMTDCAVGCTEIDVSNSSDGGVTWGAAALASQGTEDIYEFQSPSLAVDPSNPKRMYAAYININSGILDFGDCDGFTLAILEVVASADGGKTWTGRGPNQPPGIGNPKLQPDHTCVDGLGPDARHTGSLATPAVVVSPDGEVYVVYEFVALDVTGAPAANEIRVVRSVDHGQSYSDPVTVASVAIDNALPQIAVDRTNSRNRGQIYVVWSGSLNGKHTDVLLSDSVDEGATFSFPRAITSPPVVSAGRFQTNPSVAVDNDGQAAACFYQTRTDTPSASSVYSFQCLMSSSHGATWQVSTVHSNVPVGYGAVTTDFLLHNDGFFTVFEIANGGASGGRRVVGQKLDMQ